MSVQTIRPYGRDEEKVMEQTMRQMTLGHIADACGGRYIGPEDQKQREISGAATDSRKVKEGYLFFPIRGEHVDGHTFIPQAFVQGALAVLSEHVLTDPAGPYILTENTPGALREIAGYYRSVLEIPVVGIAGSVGKTSTKEMVASVLAQRYRVLKTEGNFNNEIGLPLTILGIRGEHEAAVVEMGISDFGEMHRLAKIARPDICVMTNIGYCHLENLKSRDGIWKAKSEMFDYLTEDGTVILNGNDDILAGIRRVRDVTPVHYFVEGRGERPEGIRCPVTASEVKNLGLEGVSFVLHFPEEERHVKISLPGEHNVSNALAAACVGRALGLDNEEILRGIESAGTISGRSRLLHADGLTVIDDCYNANPVSMRAALDILASCGGRRIAVLGDMGELGEEEEQLHAQTGAYAARKGIDVLFCSGKLSEKMAETAAEGCEVHYERDTERMLRELAVFVRPGDTVLVKASHFMGYSRIVKFLTKEA